MPALPQSALYLLVAIIIIGLVIENLVFGTIERLTVRRWGMQR